MIILSIMIHELYNTKVERTRHGHLLLHLTLEFLFLQFLVLWLGEADLNALSLQVESIEFRHRTASFITVLEVDESVV